MLLIKSHHLIGIIVDDFEYI